MMKKLLILLLSALLITLSGCVGYKDINIENDNVQNPSVNRPLPPFTEDDDEENKKIIYIKSKASGLRIRSGAGSSYSVIGSIEKNDLLLFDGVKENYYVTKYKEQIGYVHADYCQLVEISQSNSQVEKAISFGASLLGYPYVWGSQRYHWGNGVINKNFVNGEFDCSAFVQYIYYKTNGVLLDVTSRSQSTNGVVVKDGDLKRGDLMFFTNASRKNKTGIEKVGHVGIYFGDNYILHTASDYAVIEPISSLRWSYYLHARRVV